MVLTAILAAAIGSGGWGSFGHVGIESLVIVAVYLFGMRSVYLVSRPTAPPEQLVFGFSVMGILARQGRVIDRVRIESIAIVVIYVGAVWLLVRSVA